MLISLAMATTVFPKYQSWNRRCVRENFGNTIRITDEFANWQQGAHKYKHNNQGESEIFNFLMPVILDRKAYAFLTW